MLRASPRTTAGLHPWFCKCNWTVCRAANSKYTELSVRRFRPEISCSVPHRASGKAVPSLHPSSLFRVSGTQRIHFTTDAMTAPLTLTPKSIRNFQGECALTRNRSVPQECAACIGTVQSERVWGVPNKHFAAQNRHLYRRMHCLPQQYDLSVRIQLLSVLSQFSKILALSHSRRQIAYSKISCSMEAGAGALHRSGAANQGKEQGAQSVG